MVKTLAETSQEDVENYTQKKSHMDMKQRRICEIVRANQMLAGKVNIVPSQEDFRFATVEFIRPNKSTILLNLLLL